MEIPVRCRVKEQEPVTAVMIGYNRPSDCPIVEMPPHGRLVDGDKLLADHNTNENWDYMVLECIIRNAPTVVEASGCEKHN